MKRLLVEKGLPVVGVIVFFAQLFLWLPNHVRDMPTCDVDVYQAAARRAVAHQQVYGTQPRNRIDDVPSGFYYPPTALAFLAPAAHVSQTTWRYACFGLAVIASWMLAAALVKIGTGTVDLRRTLSVGVLLALFPPIEQSLNVGNLDMVIIAMTAWALAAPRFAAPLLVVAASIKIYPAFALFALYPRIDRKFPAGLTALTMLILLMPLAAGPTRYLREWIVLGLPSMSQPVAHYGNWSLSTILVYPDFTPEVANIPRHTRWILSLAPIAAAATAAFVTRKKPMRIAATATLVAGTWFTPFCWWWRILPLLVIPAAVWWRYAHQAPCASCTGRGWFNEPTNFGAPDGMEKICCRDCAGQGKVPTL